MSGGRKINDHAFWAGGKSKESPMPMQSKMKQERSAEGDGHEPYYEDTTEAIKSSQDMAAKKAKSLKMKDGFRY